MDDGEIRARAAALLAGDLSDEEALAELSDLAEMAAPRCATLAQAAAG